MNIITRLPATLLAAAVFLFPVATARAQDRAAPERADPPTLTVTGRAEVSADPDLAVVRLGATAQAEQAAAAQRQVNEIVQRALAAIRQQGVGEKQVTTVGLSLSPVYSDPGLVQPGQGRQEPRVVGYRASNVIRVELTDVNAVGPVIDAGVKAGANEIQGVSFELRDDRKPRAEALRRAAASARAKAEALAEAAGVRLDSVYEVVEGGANVIGPPVPHYRTMALAAEVASPVEPGQVRVEAGVTIRYRIGNTDVVPANKPAPREAVQRDPAPTGPKP